MKYYHVNFCVELKGSDSPPIFRGWPVKCSSFFNKRAVHDLFRDYVKAGIDNDEFKFTISILSWQEISGEEYSMCQGDTISVDLKSELERL